MKFEMMDTGPYLESVHHALDEVILQELDTEKPVIRFWYRKKPAVPLGRFQSFTDEVNQRYVESKKIDVVRRITGGGAMYVEPGKVITYSLYLPRSFVPDDFEESYRKLDSWAVEGLRDMGIDARHEPLNDIVCEEGKLGGSAQLRKRDRVLHHATLNYNISIEEMLKCLRIGKDKISDKAIKSAEKRVSAIGEKTDLSVKEVIDQLKKAFGNNYGVERISLNDHTLEKAEELAKYKFSSDEWNKKL